MLHLNQKTKEKSNQSKEKFMEHWKYWFYTHKPLKGGTRTKSYSYDE